MELLTWLKANEPSVMFVLITGILDRDGVKIFLRHGAKDVIYKRPVREQVVNVVKNCLVQIQVDEQLEAAKKKEKEIEQRATVLAEENKSYAALIAEIEQKNENLENMTAELQKRNAIIGCSH